MSKDIEKILEGAIQDKIFPGCSFAVVTGDDMTALNLGTFTYEEDSQKVDGQTTYDIASLTKVIAPMSIMMRLIDAGKVNLEDSIGMYLPDFANSPEKKGAKIKHLMTYTLDYDVSGGSKSVVLQMSTEEIIKRVIEQPLKYAPGTAYMYSNLTAFLLSQVIEKITGEKLEAVFQQEVATPVGLSATFVPNKENIPPTEITEDRGEVQGIVHDEFTHKLQQGGIQSGAAGLFTTAEDVGKFIQNILNQDERIFSKEIVNLWTEDLFPELLPVHTPLGWGDFNNKFLDEYHREMVVKGGFTGCFIAIDLKNKKGFVLLSNRTYPQRPDDGSAFGNVKDELMKVVFG